MSAALQPFDLPGFLAWEAEQPVKYEFDGASVRAMVGVSVAHGRVQANLIGTLYARLRGSRCEVFGPEVKVRVGAGSSIRYPDAFIVCSRPAGAQSVIGDPVVVFEILSRSTAGTDRIVKNAEYAATPSIRRYVMLEQDRMGATVFSRDGGGDWTGHLRAGADVVLALPEAGIELPLAELYEGVELTPDPPSAPDSEEEDD